MIVTGQCPVYSSHDCHWQCPVYSQFSWLLLCSVLLTVSSHDCHCAVSCLQSVLMIVTGQCPAYSQLSWSLLCSVLFTVSCHGCYWAVSCLPSVLMIVTVQCLVYCLDSSLFFLAQSTMTVISGQILQHEKTCSLCNDQFRSFQTERLQWVHALLLVAIKRMKATRTIKEI